jgi:hypothetical protein
VVDLVVIRNSLAAVEVGGLEMPLSEEREAMVVRRPVPEELGVPQGEGMVVVEVLMVQVLILAVHGAEAAVEPEGA